MTVWAGASRRVACRHQSFELRRAGRTRSGRRGPTMRRSPHREDVVGPCSGAYEAETVGAVLDGHPRLRADPPDRSTAGVPHGVQCPAVFFSLGLARVDPSTPERQATACTWARSQCERPQAQMSLTDAQLRNILRLSCRSDHAITWITRPDWRFERQNGEGRDESRRHKVRRRYRSTARSRVTVVRLRPLRLRSC